MLRIHRAGLNSAFIMFCVLANLLPATASAYNQYSQNGDATYCAGCHGDFRSNLYISPVDGQVWGNIHNLHRSDMLSGDCDACHLQPGRFPVRLAESVGGSGLAAIGCMGCHGRAEDNTASNPSWPNGLGAGLRQHHTNAGLTVCIPCHDDASPANYTPVGEEVLPPYYADPGTNHAAMPTESCNGDGGENFAGATIGLDNNGDLLYDGDAPGCNLSGVLAGLPPMASLTQNHPNPFNPSTHIQYTIDMPGHVRLQVFSVTGELVRTLVDVRHDEARTYRVAWDGRDSGGRSLASGVFFYRLESPRGIEMKKMTLLK